MEQSSINRIKVSSENSLQGVTTIICKDWAFLSFHISNTNQYLKQIYKMGTYVIMTVSNFISLLEDIHNCSEDNSPKLVLKETETSNYNSIKTTCAAFQCCDENFSQNNIHVINDSCEESRRLQLELDEVLKVDTPSVMNNSHLSSLGFHIELENLPIKSEESDTVSLVDTCEVLIEEKDPLAFDDNNENDIGANDKIIMNENCSVTLNNSCNIINKKEHIPNLLMWSAKPTLGIYKTQTSDSRKKYPESFTCEYCGKCFTGKDRAYNFYLHRNREHTHEMAYKCTTCSKTFWGERELAAHVMSHSSSVYVCHICGKKLSTKKTLNVHILIHSERKFSCSYCNKQFVRSDHLQVHQRIHTGTRPYQCDKCDSGFTQKHVLKLHKRRCPLVIKENRTSGTDLSIAL